MDSIFLEIVNMSITASWLIVAVIILRFFLKKAPKFINKILWGLVGIRLICPFTFESILSLIPSSKPIPTDIIYSPAPKIESGIPAVNNAVNPVIKENFTPDVATSVNPLQVITFILSALWVSGILFMIIYSIVSYIKLIRKTSASINLRDNIYICDNITTPFVFGIIKPKIFIPSHISENQTDYIIAHENTHIRHRDHWWKPLGFIILSLHWFNPLVWVAYILLCKDIELACDEAVVKKADTEYKKGYSETLMDCSIRQRKMIITCPIAFGEVSVKERIKSVLNYKKPTLWIIIVAIVLSVAVAIGFMTSPLQTNKSNKAVPAEISQYSELLKEQEMLPALDELGDYEKLDFYEYSDYDLLFTSKAYTLKVTYDENNYFKEEYNVLNFYNYKTHIPYYDEKDAIKKEPKFKINSFEFQIVEDIGSIRYPQNILFIGVSNLYNQIVYIYYTNTDLDYIAPSFEDFLRKDCGWETPDKVTFEDYYTLRYNGDNHTYDYEIKDKSGNILSSEKDVKENVSISVISKNILRLDISSNKEKPKIDYHGGITASGTYTTATTYFDIEKGLQSKDFYDVQGEYKNRVIHLRTNDLKKTDIIVEDYFDNLKALSLYDLGYCPDPDPITDFKINENIATVTYMQGDWKSNKTYKKSIEIDLDKNLTADSNKNTETTIKKTEPTIPESTEEVTETKKAETTEATTQPETTVPTTQPTTKEVKVKDYPGTKGFVANKKLSLHIIDMDLDRKVPVIKVQWNNKTGKTIVHGTDSFIYRKTDNGLVDCDLMDNRAFTTVAIIANGENPTRKIELYKYDLSEKGTYVLKFGFDVEGKNRKDTKYYNATLEFKVS